MSASSAPPTRRGHTAWRAVAATTLAVAGLSALGYAGWMVTYRRDLFTAIGEAGRQDDAVSLAAAQRSDALGVGWWSATALLLGFAMLLWVLARLRTRRPLGPVGFAGICTIVVGLLVVGGGAYVASTAQLDADQADQVAFACLLVGAGALLVSLGLFAGVASVVRRQPGDRPSYLGYAGWRTG